MSQAFLRKRLVLSPQTILCFIFPPKAIRSTSSTRKIFLTRIRLDMGPRVSSALTSHPAIDSPPCLGSDLPLSPCSRMPFAFAFVFIMLQVAWSLPSLLYACLISFPRLLSMKLIKRCFEVYYSSFVQTSLPSSVDPASFCISY